MVRSELMFANGESLKEDGLRLSVLAEEHAHASKAANHRVAHATLAGLHHPLVVVEKLLVEALGIFKSIFELRTERLGEGSRGVVVSQQRGGILDKAL